MLNKDIPRILIIAGSDSGGGAGVQADVKTCAAFGVYSATAITAVTAQNTLGVQRVGVLAPDLVTAQIDSVLSDIGADIIKIGMLANAGIINTVVDILEEKAADTRIVLDPVSVATSGDRLLDEEALVLLRDRMLPMADMLTPNIPEAEALTCLEIDDIDTMIKAGDKLLETGACAVLMKGGHLKGKTVIDVLVSADGHNVMTAPGITSENTHGTGCTLASAIAAGLALGSDRETAVNDAREFVFDAIRTAPDIGSGHGPLNHGLQFPNENNRKSDDSNPFSVLKTLKT